MASHWVYHLFLRPGSYQEVEDGQHIANLIAILETDPLYIYSGFQFCVVEGFLCMRESVSQSSIVLLVFFSFSSFSSVHSFCSIHF